MFLLASIAEDFTTLGRLHMLLLHLPIGLGFGVLMLELFLGFQREASRTPIGILSWLWFATAIMAMVTGLMLESHGDYGEEMSQHRILGIVMTILVFLLALVHTLSRQCSLRGSLWAFRGLLLLTLVLMAAAGHEGGIQTHGKGYLSALWKPEKKSATRKAAKEKQTAAELDDSDAMAMGDGLSMGNMNMEGEDLDALTEQYYAVLDIFESKCFSCHGNGKRKGKYSMDSRAAAFAGGKSGATAIVSGEPDESELVLRIFLPEEDDDLMPPIEKPQLDEEEKALIRAWVRDGAFWPGQAQAHSARSSRTRDRNLPKSAPLSASSLEAMAALQELGIRAEPTHWPEGGAMVDLAYHDAPPWEQILPAVEQIGQEVLWLDARRQELPASFFETLGELKALRRLHLEHSSVTDAQLRVINQHSALIYLNVYGTKISNGALKSLRRKRDLRIVSSP